VTQDYPEMFRLFTWLYFSSRLFSENLSNSSVQ
jgi:hypothetical protein